MYTIEKSIGYNENESTKYNKKPNILVINNYDSSSNRNIESTYLVNNAGEKIFIDNDLSYISDFNKGVSIVRKYDESMLIDYNGSKLTKDNFVEISGPVNDLYIGEYMDSSKVLINSLGNVISNKYQRIEPFIDNYFLVLSNGNVGIVDKNGKELLIPIKSKQINKIKNDYNSRLDVDEDTLFVSDKLDKNTKIISKIPDSNLFIIYDSNSTYGYKLMNTNLEKTTDSYYDLRVEDDNLVINNNSIIPISKLKLIYKVKMYNGNDYSYRYFNDIDTMNLFYSQMRKVINSCNKMIEEERNKVISENRLFESEDLKKINEVEKLNNYIFKGSLERLNRQFDKKIYKK